MHGFAFLTLNNIMQPLSQLWRQKD